MDRDDHSQESSNKEESSDGDLSGARPSTDELYQALAAEPRRRILSHLLEQPTTSVDEMADVLTGWRAIEENEVVGPDVRERTYSRLHHVDLPMLEDVGLLTYDVDDDEIRLSSLADPVRDTIEGAIDYEAGIEPDQS